jgi:integrase
VRAEVIRLACERPADSDVPLARWSSAELAAEVVARGICEQISGVTVWRWLSEDAIKPWQYRSWIFPRDPEFTVKAGRILDLYGGRWEGELLHPGDYVVCCDEKPSIQARRRKHATLPATIGVRRGQRVEHEYERRGALCYLAAWDARRAKLFDRCAPAGGIVPFDQLVEQFMSVEPYSKAQRVFVIVDNGSAHRGNASIKRLQGRYQNLILTTGRRAAIATLLLGGGRASATGAMVWRDLDLANGRFEVGRDKTDAGMREVDMLPLLREILTEHKAASEHTGPNDPVFVTSAGKARSRHNLRKDIVDAVVAHANRLVEERGTQPLPLGITPHKLRHTFASILVAIGKDPTYVMQQLGHTDPAFTLRVYSDTMRRGEEERTRLKALVEGHDWSHIGHKTAESASARRERDAD